MIPPTQSRSASTLPEGFTWLSNPLDWRPIDRFILLAGLVMIAPALFGLTLLAAMLYTPDYLDPGTARLLLVMYAVHALWLGGYLAVAFRRRHQNDDWPAFENVIIASFGINVLAGSYATGTHFTEGLQRAGTIIGPRVIGKIRKRDGPVDLDRVARIEHTGSQKRGAEITAAVEPDMEAIRRGRRARPCGSRSAARSPPGGWARRGATPRRA